MLTGNRRFRYTKFHVEGVAPTNHSLSQKTRLNVLSYGIKIWTDFSSVLSQFTRLTDGRTDRRIDRFSLLDRVCIPCSAVKLCCAFGLGIYSVPHSTFALLRESWLNNSLRTVCLKWRDVATYGHRCKVIKIQVIELLNSGIF